MKPFILFGLSFLAPFVGALPARDVVLMNETSCQTDGGGELGSIICKDTVCGMALVARIMWWLMIF